MYAIVLRMMMSCVLFCALLAIIMRGMGTLLPSHVLTFWADYTVYLLDIDKGLLLPLLTDFRNPEFSLSPDGQRIAFTGATTDGNYIYVADVITPQETRILTDNYNPSNQPTWSPDGTHIAFVSVTDGRAEIYVMNTDGSGIQQVTDISSCSSPSWSPDSARLAYVCDSALYWSALERGEPQRLTPEDMTVTISRPAWSPDGNRLLFSVNEDRYRYELYIVELSNDARLQLIPVEDDLQPFFPQWSPDGTLIAFLDGGDILNNSGRRVLYVMNVDGSDVRLVSDDLLLFSPAWGLP